MRTLLCGGNSGVVRVEAGSASPEEGPTAAGFFARSGDATYAMSSAGELWARNRSGNWRLINAHAIPDEVWSFGADPRLDGRLYAGVSPALLYRSDNGGETWTACQSLRQVPGYDTWTFPPPPHIPHVRSIAADRETPGALYIGVEEGGIYRSPDGGETWQSLNEGLYWDVHTVTPAVSGEDLFATTGAGFHRSHDRGGHWQHIGMPRRYTVPFLVSQSQPGRLYTAAAAGPPPSWREGVNAAIYRSDDSGESWQELHSGLPDRFNVMVGALAENPDGDLYAAAGRDLYASGDGGDRWRLVAGGLPPVRALSFA
jgi:photosystem II stability/assembly factor-like uncharacterized protein